MVEELLVGRQLTPEMIAVGKSLVAVLDKRGVTVKGAFWVLLPDNDAWRLMIASPEVRQLGPKAVYRKIYSALAKLPPGMAVVGLKDITVVEEKAPLYTSLRSAMPTDPGISGVRVSREYVNGHLIEEAYLYRVT